MQCDQRQVANGETRAADSPNCLRPIRSDTCPNAIWPGIATRLMSPSAHAALAQGNSPEPRRPGRASERPPCRRSSASLDIVRRRLLHWAGARCPVVAASMRLRGANRTITLTPSDQHAVRQPSDHYLQRRQQNYRAHADAGERDPHRQTPPARRTSWEGTTTVPVYRLNNSVPAADEHAECRVELPALVHQRQPAAGRRRREHADLHHQPRPRDVHQPAEGQDSAPPTPGSRTRTRRPSTRAPSRTRRGSAGKAARTRCAR